MFEAKKSLTTFSLISFLFFGSGFILLLDQIIKHKIRLNGGFYVCNKGISFNLPIYDGLFWLILTVFLFLGFIYISYLLKNGLFSVKYLLAFTLILGGVVSNASDRLLFSCVIDIFSINMQFFPVFNIADMAIFLGSCLLILLILRKNNQ